MTAYLCFLIAASALNAALLFTTLLLDVDDSPPRLLFAGFAVLAINVLTFALIYWWLDGGGPRVRAMGEVREWDFQYPQQASGQTDWTPRLSRLPLHGVHQPRRVQPHRHDAADAASQAAVHARVGDLAGDDPRHREPGDQHAALTGARARPSKRARLAGARRSAPRPPHRPPPLPVRRIRASSRSPYSSTTSSPRSVRERLRTVAGTRTSGATPPRQPVRPWRESSWTTLSSSSELPYGQSTWKPQRQQRAVAGHAERAVGAVEADRPAVRQPPDAQGDALAGADAGIVHERDHRAGVPLLARLDPDADVRRESSPVDSSQSQISNAPVAVS